MPEQQFTEEYQDLLIRRINFEYEQEWNEYHTRLDELLRSILGNIQCIRPTFKFSPNWYIRKYELGIKELDLMLEATEKAKTKKNYRTLYGKSHALTTT